MSLARRLIESSTPSHLDALELRLSNERIRLANATSEKERRQRSVWVAQMEREIESERGFIGEPAADPKASDEDLLADLGL